MSIKRYNKIYAEIIGTGSRLDKTFEPILGHIKFILDTNNIQQENYIRMMMTLNRKIGTRQGHGDNAAKGIYKTWHSFPASLIQHIVCDITIFLFTRLLVHKR